MFFHPKSTKNKCMQINNHSIQYLENLFQIKVFMREAYYICVRQLNNMVNLRRLTLC